MKLNRFFYACTPQTTYVQLVLSYSRAEEA
jgi:hypothetical protein